MVRRDDTLARAVALYCQKTKSRYTGFIRLISTREHKYNRRGVDGRVEGGNERLKTKSIFCCTCLQFT